MIRFKTGLLLGCTLMAFAGLSPLSAPVTQAEAKPAAKRKAETQIEAARLSEHIRVLSSDAFEGRGIGTPGEQKTLDYMIAQFKAAGFQPGGVKGSWLQPVTLKRMALTANAITATVAGKAMSLTQGEDVTLSTRLPSPEVSLKDVPLLFAGYGVTAPERGWDDFKGLDVTGKIIVVLVNDPDFYAQETGTFGGKAMTYYGRWTYKYEEAARRGAAGVLIIHDTPAAGYGWATVKNSWSGPQFDIVRADPRRERVPVEGWLSADAASRLFAGAGLDLEALKVAARSKDFRPVALNGASLSVAATVETSTIETNNVLARLPGSKYPEESVLYTGHWDHLGVGLADAKGDRIYNGAVDNATGIAGLLELARVFAAGPRPKRSLVMIGFTAEESGLLGSEAYATNPVWPLAKTAGGVNMDAMNVYGATRNIQVVGKGKSELEADLLAVATQQGRRVEGESSPQAGIFFRSDHFPLAKQGVPMLYAKGGLDLVKGGEAAGQAAAGVYGKDKYHQPADEWSADWDLSGMVEDLELFRKVGFDLANSRRWPNWMPDAEFRVARDASAAERK